MKKNNIWMLAAILVCGLNLTACTNNDNPAEPVVTPDDEVEMPEVSRDFDKVVDWFAAAVKKCHPNIQKAWNTDADPSDFNLLLANEEKTRIYLINPDTKKEIPQTEWTSELKQNLENATGFKHLVFDGMNSTIILVKFKEFDAQKGVMEQVMGRQLDDKYYLLQTLALFYHESFHEYVQKKEKGWQKSSGYYNRNQFYPIDYTPRIYRKLALLALKAAWDDSSQKEKQYARAKYWTAKYEQAYAEEAEGIKSTDIDEGTADYFERNVLHPAFNDYPLLNEFDGYNLGSRLETESYMSSIAIQLASREGKLSQAIEAFKSQELTPINFLLKDVAVPTDYDESLDAADSERIRQITSKFFGDESAFIQPVIQAYNTHKAGSATYFVVRSEKSNNFTSQGSYVLTDLPGYECIVNYTVSSGICDINEKTILMYDIYYLIPMEDTGALVLVDQKYVQDVVSPIKDIVITQEAQVTAVDGVSDFTMKEIPVKVYIGKDSYGNTYYICTE